MERLAAVALLLLLPGCGGLLGGDEDDDGGSGSNNLIEDAQASCDPSASAWDDLFIFEAWTTNGTDKVEFDVYVGNSFVGSERLTARGSGYWYRETWADDLDADCDDWNRMYFEIFAEDGSTEDSASISP